MVELPLISLFPPTMTDVGGAISEVVKKASGELMGVLDFKIQETAQKRTKLNAKGFESRDAMASVNLASRCMFMGQLANYLEKLRLS